MPAQNRSALAPTALDHVALWVEDRQELSDFLCGHLGMHVIERTDAFTLVGADARLGKITLFAAEGRREPGVLERVVLRVQDLDRALEQLPPRTRSSRVRINVAHFPGPQGLGLGLTEVPEATDYDVDRVVLRVPDPVATAAALERLGFQADGERLYAGDRHVRLSRGVAAESDRPLLNHIALLVDSAQSVEHEVRRRGLHVSDVRDAANTQAVFVRGPDGVELEYVEHKPSFSLR